MRRESDSRARVEWRLRRVADASTPEWLAVVQCGVAVGHGAEYPSPEWQSCNVVSLWAMGLQLFRKHFESVPEVQRKVPSPPPFHQPSEVDQLENVAQAISRLRPVEFRSGGLMVGDASHGAPPASLKERCSPW